MVHVNLDATDAKTLSTYQDMKHGAKKHPPDDVTDLTSPITKSTGTSSKKSRSFFQTILVGARQTSPGATQAANVAITHSILANDKAHTTAEDHLLLRMLRCVQNCGSDYKPPTRYEIGGILLDASYETYYNDEVSKMMKDVKIYGASIYGDGATVKGTPKINVLASTPSNPACVLDVIDCTMHMQEGELRMQNTLQWRWLR